MKIDPEIYNYDALTPEDQAIIDGFDEAVDELDAFDPEIDLEADSGSTLGKIKIEIAEEVITRLREQMACTRLELIASIMDSGEEYNLGGESITPEGA